MTQQTIAVLRVLLATPAIPRYGLEIARETGLKTGTLHPILARLRQAGWIEATWEQPAEHEDQGRPRRRYYSFAGDGAVVACRAVQAAGTNPEPNPRPRPCPGYGGA
jgi:PadR family transcriptional regulator, regulatory protein PadR